MSAKQEIFDQSRFVELSEDDLKEALGFMWDRAKALKDAEKTDVEVERLKGELKIYITDHFSTERKRLEKDLRAARAIAKLRGIQWKAPKP